MQPLIKQSAKVELDQLETPEARALYRTLRLIKDQLPADEPLITEIIAPLFPMLQSVCLDIDKNPETRKKVYDFLLELSLIIESETGL